MSATLARVAFVTEQFRWHLQLDATIAQRHLRARSETEIPSFCTDLTGAERINGDLFDLLSGDAQILEVDADPLPEGIDFARFAPTAHLSYSPWGLDADMLIVGVTSAVRADGLLTGKVLLW